MNKNNLKELEKAIKEMTDKVKGWDDIHGRVDGFTKTIKEICIYYAEKLGYTPAEVFKALEEKRDYSYPNYYQWAKFPKLEDVKVYKDQEELLKVIQPEKGFRCPSCVGVSKDPYTCDTGIERKDKKICDWKSYGVFGTLGKGIRLIIVKDWLKNPIVDSCFMPISMES